MLAASMLAMISLGIPISAIGGREMTEPFSNKRPVEPQHLQDERITQAHAKRVRRAKQRFSR